MQDIDTVDFIGEIMNRPIIWNSKHEKYKNKIITRRMWDEMKQKFPGTRVDDLKKKWKNLRDTYRKELKKYPKQSDPLRPDLDETFESCWKYFNLMSFTREEIKTNDANTTQGEESNEDTVMNTEDNNMILEEPPVDVKVETVYFSDDESGQRVSMNVKPMQHEVNVGSYEIKIENAQQPTDNLLKPTSIVREENDDTAESNSAETSKRTRPQDLREQYLEIERKKLKILESESLQSNKSQDYHFLMSLLPEIEKLPIINRLRIRNKYNNILMEELQSLNSHSNS